jgi:hypothetical protein
MKAVRPVIASNGVPYLQIRSVRTREVRQEGKGGYGNKYRLFKTELTEAVPSIIIIKLSFTTLIFNG